MEKEQKQELGWRVSVLPIPAFHHCEPLCVACTQCIFYSGMQEWVIQIPSIPILVSVLFPSLNLKYFRIKFLLLVHYNNIRKANLHYYPVNKLANLYPEKRKETSNKNIHFEMI